MFLTSVVWVTLLASVSVQDAPRVSARTSTTSATVGETLVFEIRVEGASGDVEIGMPRFPRGLALQGTQDFTEMQITLPGGRSITRRREFALQAATGGRFSIPSVAVRVGNRSYRTNAVDVLVAGTTLRRELASSDEAWLRATMQPETVYVGQQSTLTVEAGFSEDVRVRLTRPPVFDTPSPTGFWVQNVPGGVRSRLRAVNGRVTEIQSFQRAYFPLSAGRFAFAPARAIIDVREGFLFAPETREIRSASPRLTVLPLPEAGRPADFKGAVGSFTVRASIQPDTVAAGEAAQITIELSGHGNVKAAPQPTLPGIAGVEQFAPTEDATVEFSGALVRGTKQFQWVIIPDRAGSLTIPPVSYSFFEPATRAYRTVRTEALTLVVRGAATADEEIAASAAALRAIRTAPERASLRWVRTREFLFAQIVPLLLMASALAVMLLRRRLPASRSHLDELRRIRRQKTEYSEFLRDLENMLRVAGADRGDDVDPVIGARLAELITRIEAQRFAPAAAQAAEREALLKEAEAVIRSLTRRRPRGQRAPAVFAMLALAQLHAPADFERGTELYRAGQFALAARAFETVVARDSTDIAAWANLGNAYFRAGDRGRAIWAWARATRAAPRDGAIVRNLRAAGAVEVLRTRPPLSVRPVEWYLLAAIGWWIAGALAALAIVRRSWALLAWALPAVAIVVIALTIGAIADGRVYAVALNDETRMYGDPTIHSPIVRRVQSGAGLDVLEERGDWLRVRTVAQAEGWVEADAVGKL